MDVIISAACHFDLLIDIILLRGTDRLKVSFLEKKEIYVRRK